MKQYDTIVIGSGISGLTSALILAKQGKKVAVLEKDHDIAPLVRPYRRLGCDLSPGLHICGWMDHGDAMPAYLKYLKVDDGVEIELEKDGYGDMEVNGKRYHIPRGYDQVEKALLGYFPENANAVKNYVRLVKESNDRSFYFNLSLPPSKHPGFVDLANVTLRQCLEQYGASNAFIELVGKLCYFLVGSRDDEMPFIMHAFVMGGFYHSPGYFTIEGTKKMLSNFRRELADHGADIFTDAEAVEIKTGENRNVTGVRTANGEEFHAPEIVVSCNPKLLAKITGANAFRPIFRKRLEEAENTFGMYVAFYKTNDGREVGAGNSIWSVDGGNVLAGLITNHSGGKNDRNSFTVFLEDDDKILPTDDDGKRTKAAAKLKLLEELTAAKFPELKNRAVLLDFLKPWSFERYTGTANGSAYGIKRTLSSIGFQHKVPLHGLYLVGQAIYPGFMGSMISGFSLAFELFEETNFWEGVMSR